MDENYGLNLLKNMGLKEDDKNNLILFNKRPSNLGLGCQEQILTEQEKIKKFKIDDRIKVIKGKHKDIICKIKIIDNDDIICYNEINFLEYYFKADQIEIFIETNLKSTKNKEENLKEILQDREKPKKKLKWIIEDIYIKIISKTINNGNYYKLKGRVIDIIDQYRFQVQLNNTIIDTLTEKDIQTYIPKPGSQVKILKKSENYKKIGKLIKINRKEKLAHVHILGDQDVEQYKLSEISLYESL